MNLLIVESPGKIEKLKHILGDGWDVKASYGHIRDLPKNDMGVEAPDFEPHYEATERGAKTIALLKEAVAKADEVYLATDPDREGEAIAWHLADELKLTNYKRVTYTSITPKEVMAGVNNARSIDMALVKAQEARRVLDRFCGYTTSMPLSNVIGETVSAGRVQSPAVRLVVERERAIRSFKVTQHYGVKATFEYVENVQDGWTAKWNTENFLAAGQEYVLDKSIAEKITAIRTFDVVAFEESNKKVSPPAPFTTSTLQQAASNALKFTPKETMSIAQSLYEAGLITYMRTDSPNLSDEAYEEVKSFALQENLPVADQKRTWKSKENSQEAHEAIRPTDISVYDIEAGDKERQLYKLIRDRALACVLKDAVFAVREVELKALMEEKEVFFNAKGSTLTEHGWKTIFAKDQTDEGDEEPSNNIPILKTGNQVTAQKSEVTEHKTKAPSRYTQASLIRDLEKEGIGRPATYAGIMSNILDREYIKEDDKHKLSATALGEKLFDAMLGSFSFLNLDYTKSMEEELDNIAESKSSYLELVSKAYETLAEEVAKYSAKSAIPCPKCGYALKHLKGTNKDTKKPYDFFVCENESCEATFNNVNGKPVERSFDVTEHTCIKCGAKLVHRTGTSQKDGKPYDFFACSNKDCGMNYDNKDGVPVEHEKNENTGRPTEYTCPKCGKMLVARPTSKGGIWYACSGYPKCQQKFWAKDDGTPNFENAPASKKSTTIKAKRK